MRARKIERRKEKKTSKDVKNSSRDDDSQINNNKNNKETDRQTDRSLFCARVTKKKKKTDTTSLPTDPIRSFECFDLCYFSFLCLSFLSRFVKKYLISLLRRLRHLFSKKETRRVVCRRRQRRRRRIRRRFFGERAEKP